MERLQKQLEFIIEVDQLKTILRQSQITDNSRRENDAEHSWHLALMAVILGEHASDPDLDLFKVIKMLLIHDIVEIDAGDTFAYDQLGNEDKQEREEKAAQRIFRLLPEDQFSEVYNLWMEFERNETSEAKFANALDRLQPMMLNVKTEGYSWKKHGITSKQVYERNRQIQDGSTIMWDYAKQLIEEAVGKSYLIK